MSWNVNARTRGGRTLPVLSLLTALVWLLWSPLPAAADIIFDSGPNPSDVNGVARSDADSVYTGGDFTLGTLTAVNEVQWTGGYGTFNTPSTDIFTIEFYEFSSVLTPATTPLETYLVGNVDRIDTGEDVGSLGDRSLFSYQTTIPVTNLSAGHYLVSIFNDTTADTGFDWFWGSVSGPDTIFQRNGKITSWSPNDDITLDFTLLGQAAAPAAVPEPGSMILLGTGLASLMGYGGWRRKRRGLSDVAA